MAGATGLEPATFGAGSAEVLQLPVLVLAEDDGVLCPHGKQQIGRPPGRHACGSAGHPMGDLPHGWPRDVSFASRVSLIVVPGVVPRFSVNSQSALSL